jgi:FKBP-type peptidyl-prolyl cis-trans isomerase
LTPASTTPLNVPADSGMTADLPKLDAPEWEPVGKDGLKKWDVLVGSGLEVQVTNEVEFHYTGWLTNGNVFDSSWKGGKPISFQIRGLIPGWIQGIPGMRVGGIRRLYVPSHLGYGAQDKGTIPPNSNLIFEIKVMRIVN